MNDDFSAEDRQAALLARYEAAFNAGDSSALLDAVSIYLMRGIETPKWVVTGFNAAWGVKWGSGQARTLDEAFDLQRPKNWTQKRARKDRLGCIIWQHVVWHRHRGEPIGRALFEAVAEDLNGEPGELYADMKFNGTDISDAYYNIERLTKKRQNSR